MNKDNITFNMLKYDIDILNSADIFSLYSDFPLLKTAMRKVGLYFARQTETPDCSKELNDKSEEYLATGTGYNELYNQYNKIYDQLYNGSMDRTLGILSSLWTAHLIVFDNKTHIEFTNMASVLMGRQISKNDIKIKLFEFLSENEQ